MGTEASVGEFNCVLFFIALVTPSLSMSSISSPHINPHVCFLGLGHSRLFPAYHMHEYSYFNTIIPVCPTCPMCLTILCNLVTWTFQEYHWMSSLV